MFVVNKDTSQVLSVNLSNEFTKDYFMFLLSGSGLTTEKFFFSESDLSISPRAVKFLITESDVENIFQGVISLPKAGDLYCKIFETDESPYLTYRDRVLTDGGTIENVQCLLSFLDSIYSGTEPTEDPIWRGLFRVFREDIEIEENATGEIQIKEYDPRA